MKVNINIDENLVEDRAEFYLQDLAAAVLGAGLYLSGAQREIHLLPAGDLPAGGQSG